MELMITITMRRIDNKIIVTCIKTMNSTQECHQILIRPKEKEFLVVEFSE